ncbi:MAG: hypothetical protein C6W57_12620 [Caldibacillus debilis]|nr:MAG: hypothetical protein C6W57_12620 [Caldibacillus debilis]
MVFRIGLRDGFFPLFPEDEARVPAQSTGIPILSLSFLRGQRPSFRQTVFPFARFFHIIKIIRITKYFAHA